MPRRWPSTTRSSAAPIISSTPSGRKLALPGRLHADHGLRACQARTSVISAWALREDAPAEKRHQGRAQRVRALRGEYHLGPRLIAFLDWRPEQSGHTPRDGARGSDPVDRPRRERCQAVEQQRIVGAGQHDRVGAILAVSDKAGGKLGYDILVAHVVSTEAGLVVRG